MASLLWEANPFADLAAMATLYTHAAVSLGLGKLSISRPAPWQFWATAIVLSIAPDFDVFSKYSYGSMCGHRGVTHSLVFSGALAAGAAALLYRRMQLGFWRLAVIFFTIAASHALLDMFTNGGFGVPLLWPLSDQRFGPWGPIHVADIGFEIPNPWTSRSIRTELLFVWLPLATLLGIVTLWRWCQRSGPNKPPTPG